MDFGNWSDAISQVGNFPGDLEFTNSHAFSEEVGQPFRHNPTSYFHKFALEVIGRTIRFCFKVFNKSLDFVCISRS